MHAGVLQVTNARMTNGSRRTTDLGRDGKSNFDVLPSGDQLGGLLPDAHDPSLPAKKMRLASVTRSGFSIAIDVIPCV